jgi:hypothetical protein
MLACEINPSSGSGSATTPRTPREYFIQANLCAVLNVPMALCVA